MSRFQSRHFVLCLVLSWCLSAGSVAWGSVGDEIPVYRQVAGEIRTIAVAAGDTLVSIGARVGVAWQTLAAGNHLNNPDRIYLGQELIADTRRIVPDLLEEGLVVNVPEACLYRFSNGTLVARYPVGLGRPHSPTPLGSFSVLHKEHDPQRGVPGTLLGELKNEATVVRRKLTPDADSTLGHYWIQLSAWGYGLHSTQFPTTLGQFLGYGTIRLGPETVAELYPTVRNGVRVELSYHPVKLAFTPAGEIWLEAHPDVYDLWFPTSAQVLGAIEHHGGAGQVDAEAVADILAQRDGLPRKIGSLTTGNGELTAPVEQAPSAAVAARWICLDCPPQERRRVTFQLQANAPLALPNPYPIRILNDARQVVFQREVEPQAPIQLEAGQNRNFVWEVRDSGGQPLPAGSYMAVVDFYAGSQGERQSLSLPLWVGN